MNANEERKYSRSFASFADNQTEQCQERKGRLAPFAGMAPGPGNGGGRISGGNASNKLYGGEERRQLYYARRDHRRQCYKE